ncbi:hypothetical protein [Clostridium sp. 'White wine YQ']|uniref:hypothetical protein n=1 Tax=Clostridium sp. 'White wine YQ' TaxID=3027474 RepID=UPI0023656358|nr:hypothetical protein [Clostridium sp. 'White wine YQ']MDD7794491.1 hypothetical protein [Clostridium sp. 'White wine YQ']
MIGKLMKYLNDLFWIEKFKGKNKFFLFYARVAMNGYLLFVTVSLIASIVTLNLDMLFESLLVMIFFPVIYHIIMGIHRRLHGL